LKFCLIALKNRQLERVRPHFRAAPAIVLAKSTKRWRKLAGDLAVYGSVHSEAWVQGI